MPKFRLRTFIPLRRLTIFSLLLAGFAPTNREFAGGGRPASLS